MTKPRHTTVVLADGVQKLKDEFAAVYGLKNTLSAGLILFSWLSDSKQKQIIREVNGLNNQPEDENSPSVILRILSADN